MFTIVYNPPEQLLLSETLEFLKNIHYKPYSRRLAYRRLFSPNQASLRLLQREKSNCSSETSTAPDKLQTRRLCVRGSLLELLRKKPLSLLQKKKQKRKEKISTWSWIAALPWDRRFHLAHKRLGWLWVGPLWDHGFSRFSNFGPCFCHFRWVSPGKPTKSVKKLSAVDFWAVWFPSLHRAASQFPQVTKRKSSLLTFSKRPNGITFGFLCLQISLWKPKKNEQYYEK